VIEVDVSPANKTLVTFAAALVVSLSLLAPPSVASPRATATVTATAPSATAQSLLTARDRSREKSRVKRAKTKHHILKFRGTRLKHVKAGRARVLVKRTKKRRGVVKVQWRTTQRKWKKARSVRLKTRKTRLSIRVAGRSRVWRVRPLKPRAAQAAGPQRTKSQVVKTPKKSDQPRTSTTAPSNSTSAPNTFTPPEALSTKMPQGDLPGWKQIFAEDFTQDAPLGSFLNVYSDRWDAYEQGWKDTSGHGIYDPKRTLYAANGQMGMWLRTVDGQALSAAPIPRLHGPGTDAGLGLRYGRYSVRFRADPVDGFRTAWLLWPDSNVWPDDGEINFPEGELNDQIQGFAHFTLPQGSFPSQDILETGVGYADWHIATVEWSPGMVRFLLDGKELMVSTKHVPHKAMHYVMQTETNFGPNPPHPSVQTHVKVDWISVHRYVG
jgi:hypothetical protein